MSCSWCTIDLVTVWEAILTSRQPREKLCLLENLMSNNFRKTAVGSKKNMNCKLRLHTPKDSTKNVWGRYRQLHAQEQLSKIFYTFVCKNVSSCPLKFPEKYEDIYVENLKQTSGEISAQVRPQILCCVALVYNSYHFFFFLFVCFFLEHACYGNYLKN